MKILQTLPAVALILLLFLPCAVTRFIFGEVPPPANFSGQIPAEVTAAPASLPSPTSNPTPSPTWTALPAPSLPTSETSAPEASPAAPATPYPEKNTHFVSDASGAIEANIPLLWTDTRSEDWLDDHGREIGTTFIASTDIEKFLKFQAEGVSISVAKSSPVGYIQLMDQDYDAYLKLCADPYKTEWDFKNELYRGKEVVLHECNQVPDSWFSLLSVVPIQEPSSYIARVRGLDLIPIFGDDFRTMIMKFKVHPEYLP